MPEEREEYEYIRAIVDCGSLRFEYKLKGSDVPGHQAHDESVEGWSDNDIKRVTRELLDVPEDQEIEVCWE